jgi:hypothetical protein
MQHARSFLSVHEETWCGKHFEKNLVEDQEEYVTKTLKWILGKWVSNWLKIMPIIES